EKCLYSDLHIQVFPPGIKWGYMTPITVADGHPFTWAGSTDPSELEHFERVCSPSALRELRSAWYVVAIDLTWGRADHLWHVLLEENRPGYSVTPHPDLDIEHEFYY
ncbi:MAG TPA: hypothetical protein VK399_03060, partial [Longimicrobiaceae bacterium]|nr:hypothetical protein [Longimicrobiaceae bacterium]